MKKLKLIVLVSVGLMFFASSCKKDSSVTTDSLYVPTSADVTATATLADLTQGRTLYVNNCGACHGLYSPDSFSATSWKTVLSGMVPRTGLSTANAALVAKYVSRGK